MRWLLLLLALLVGCTSAETPPAFRGKKPETNVDFNLWGTWHVTRFSLPDKPGKLGRWEGIWNLTKTQTENRWDAEGSASFLLIQKDGPILGWKQAGTWRWFSIYEHRYGMLMMLGDDEEHYFAVRTDGGN